MKIPAVIAAVAFLGGAALAADDRSPLDVAVSPDGSTLWVSDRTAGCVVALDAATGDRRAEIAIAGEPNGLVLSADGAALYVAQRQKHSIARVDTAEGIVAGEIAVGTWPVALALADGARRLYSCNRGDHTMSVVDLAAGREIARIPLARDPAFAALTADASRVIVPHFKPSEAFTDADLASEISIVDTSSLRRVARVKLPPGSTMARGACTSPDGRWAYVTHILGRFDLPITQLDQGWVHTYALSIIDIATGARVATVSLDDLTQGAADPWAIVGSADGKTLWISHRGVHEVSAIDVGLLHELLDGRVPAKIAAVKDGVRDNVWVRIQKDRRQIAELPDDLTALHIAGVIRRMPSGGIGPTGLARSPDGGKLFVANYYSGTVGVLDAATAELRTTIAVGSQPAPDAARRGEIYFHDATRCYQRWHSCASCHLDNGRVDGLPWDFLRDGIDNGKDVISLVYMQHTSPHNRRATRSDPRVCMETGIVGSHQVGAAPGVVDDLLAFAKSLRPEPNPNRAKLAPAAARGEALFQGKAGCATCHSGPYLTDREMHEVGTDDPSDPDSRYDTPSLIEAYRTPPYYHDARAATIKEALTEHDSKRLHGKLGDLSPQEIDDLVAYVLSL